MYFFHFTCFYINIMYDFATEHLSLNKQQYYNHASLNCKQDITLNTQQLLLFHSTTHPPYKPFSTPLSAISKFKFLNYFISLEFFISFYFIFFICLQSPTLIILMYIFFFVCYQNFFLSYILYLLCNNVSMRQMVSGF